MTVSDRALRTALWATVALNLLGVAVFAPLAIGRPSPLVPIATPPYYAAQMTLTIGLFAGVYAWLARQPRIDRPLVAVGGLGKLGFFALTLGYGLAGVLPASMVFNALPDLVLGALFLVWVVNASDEGRISPRGSGAAR